MNETGTTSYNNDALENGQGNEQCAQESEQEGKTECMGLMNGEGELASGGIWCE